MSDSDQLENGYIKIANGVFESLIKYRIPGEQMQCLLLILRKTYGWNQLECELSLNYFVESTGINKQAVSRALKSLADKKIISIIKKDNKSNSMYKFNKRSATWKPLSKKITLSKKIKPFIKKDNPPIKDNIKTIPPKIKDYVLRFIDWSKKTHNGKSPLKTESLISSSCETIEKIIRIDGFDQEYVFKAIGWGCKDDFWVNQIISLAGLRGKSKNKLSKFQNLAVAYDTAEPKVQELIRTECPQDDKYLLPD